MFSRLLPHLALLAAAACSCISCSSTSGDMTIRSIPSGASLRVNGEYVGQAPATLSLNRHKPIHVAGGQAGLLLRGKNLPPGNDHGRGHSMGTQQREV